MAGGEGGFALAAALLILVVIAMMVATAWSVRDQSNRAAANYTSSVEALEIAEAGSVHALALLRNELADTALTRLLEGPDGIAGTGDDGVLAGWGLPADDEIPADGRPFRGGSYHVRLLDDPADADGDPDMDSNHRIVAECRGVTGRGGETVVRAVIGSKSLPAFVAEGDLEISGDPRAVGQCGTIHGNRTVVVSGNPVVSEDVSASDSVLVGGSVSDEGGSPVEPLHHQPPVEIPELGYDDYCGEADYVLQADGDLRRISDGSVFDGEASEDDFGWKWAGGGKWEITQPDYLEEGTYCAETNVVVGSNPGEATGIPVSLSIIARGSVAISGNPVIRPDHPDGVLLLAEGDLQISGNPTGVGDNYQGLMYAGAQCEVNGNPVVAGHAMCRDGPLPAAAENYVDEIKLNGDATFDFDCGGTPGGRRLLAWYQVFGS